MPPSSLAAADPTMELQWAPTKLRTMEIHLATLKMVCLALLLLPALATAQTDLLTVSIIMFNTFSSFISSSQILEDCANFGSPFLPIFIPKQG